MTLQTAGGLAALVCAATYVVGFTLLVTVLAPLGYGTDRLDPAAVTAFIAARPGLMIAWNSTIYIVNALALAVLVVALRDRCRARAPGLAAVAGTVGAIWAALVLGAGMIANVAVEQVVAGHAADPAATAALWRTLHAVELGLGGGNEIAGAAWVALISLAGLRARSLPRWPAMFGFLIGLAGAGTVLPGAGEVLGAVFGLGFILWFAWIGAALVLAEAGRGEWRTRAV